jgi:murein DD-endopeptidase MepM/ murein hydrolase activator NlpD
MTTRKRLFTAIVICFAAFSVFIWRLSRLTPKRRLSDAGQVASGQNRQVHFETPSPSPSIEPELAPAATATATVPVQSPEQRPEVLPSPDVTPTAQVAAPTKKLLIPVAGVHSDQLVDTFTAARSEGRVHDAIDIMAPKDTPVLAAADGKIIKLFQSKPGGITIYQLDPDNKTIYYYAHLDRYADGLAEGQTVRQGDTIAFVGDTGNAGTGNYHLHFSISLVSDPKRYWEGTNINPYPLLTGKQ